VGGLARVWTGFAPADFNQLKKEFASFFQEDWSEVMVGANQPYSYHSDWNTYVGLTALREYREVLADLTRRLRQECYRIYNTIFG
jgi:hypothetical protein